MGLFRCICRLFIIIIIIIIIVVVVVALLLKLASSKTSRRSKDSMFVSVRRLQVCEHNNTVETLVFVLSLLVLSSTTLFLVLMVNVWSIRTQQIREFFSCRRLILNLVF